MPTTYTYVATCLFGLEKFVGEEIDALGYKRIETIDGRVTFEGDINAIARCNIWLRTAEHLYIKVGDTPAYTFSDLFDRVRDMPWEEWIGCDDAFPVKGHSIQSLLTSLPDCQSIIKKAICTRLGEEYGLNQLPEEGPKHQVEFFIFKDKATLMIDTSGTPLYKRGYRNETGLAPLRETLAAAMAKISRPREDVLFWDPMAGSGTIPIEAAMIMTNTAPGLRRSFAAEKFDDIPQKIFRDARDEAMSLIRHDCVFEAFASDIDPEMVAIARENVSRAGMSGRVRVFEQDALSIDTMGRRGTIVTNPPYGERLLDQKSARELYRKMGASFKGLGKWQIYILTSDEEFQRFYGRRADKVRRLYNGMIKCGLYQFFKNDDKKQSFSAPGSSGDFKKFDSSEKRDFKKFDPAKKREKDGFKK